MGVYSVKEISLMVDMPEDIILKLIPQISESLYTKKENDTNRLLLSEENAPFPSLFIPIIIILHQILSEYISNDSNFYRVI